MQFVQEFINWALFASFYSWPFAAALILGVLIPASAAVASQITKNWHPSTRMLCIILPLIIASITPIIFSGRIIYTEAQQDAMTSLQVGSGISPIGTRATQIFTLLSLVFSAGEIYRWLWGRISLYTTTKPTWLLLVAYIATSIVISNIFSDQPEFRLRDFYFFITAASIFLLAPHADDRFWNGLRLALLIPTTGSLVAYLVSPEFAALQDYTAAIPGLSIRLYGLADHANSIGFVALGAAYIEIMRKKPRHWLSALAFLIHITVLILSQSKTAWVAAVLLSGLAFSHATLNSARLGSQKWRAAITIQLAGISAFTVLSIFVFVALTSSAVESKLNDASFYNLTGRGEIWKITLEEFYKNPLTGYGPEIWNEKFRFKHGWPFVGQAHNQFVQALGQSGIIGFMSLMGYMGILLVACINNPNPNFRITAIGLYVLMLTRCVTETPLRASGIAGWDNVFHLILITSAIIGSQKIQATQPPTNAEPLVNKRLSRA